MKSISEVGRMQIKERAEIIRLECYCKGFGVLILCNELLCLYENLTTLFRS